MIYARRIALTFALLLAVLTLSGQAVGPSSVYAAVENVSIVGFAHQSVTVPIGTTVMWANNDPEAHTVTSGTGGVWDGVGFDSGNLAPGAMFSTTFDTPGAFQYTCTIHSFMNATVTVEPAGPMEPDGDRAVIFDDGGLSNAIRFSLTDVPPPNSNYEGWLIADDGVGKVSLGILPVNAGGVIDHTMSFPVTENLIDSYNKVGITVEPDGDTDPEPSDVLKYFHEIPIEAMVHIRHLLTNWPAGSDKGILTRLIEQIETAITHANLAVSGDVVSHTHHATS